MVDTALKHQPVNYLRTLRHSLTYDNGNAEVGTIAP